MQLADERLLFSPSDLIGFVECAHLTRLDTLVATGRVAIERTRSDAAELLARKASEQELSVLADLREAGKKIVEISRHAGLGGLLEAAGHTTDAMQRGVDVISQGVLFDGARWRGTADLLERVDGESVFGDWSYEVADAKLARRVKPYYLMQLCCYSELLAKAQGSDPARAHIILGSRSRESFRLADFAAYYRSVRSAFETVVDADGNATYPEPVEHCPLCKWSEHCEGRRRDDDHLSLVANMRRSQTVRLRERTITTVADLAVAADEARPPRMGAGTYETLRAQARLQVSQRGEGRPRYELLAPEPERGLQRLPPPSEGDLFFDMEGDPFFEGGLEYLFGVTSIKGGTPTFRAFWAIDRNEEKVAFEAFVDFVMERLERFPDLHVYHYAPYEPTALKRLMGLHGTREDAIDHLLRNHALVDLYAVVRQGLRIGQPSYSIKKMEAFYMEARATDVTDGGDSIVEFERYLETREPALLEAIERYNEDDCRSTWLLRDWLLDRRREASEVYAIALPWKAPPDPYTPDGADQSARDAQRHALLDGVADDPGDRDDQQRSRWLLAQLLDYHRREAKPAWWEHFARLEADEMQLVEVDNEALGGLTDSGVEAEPLPPPSRSLVHTLRFPAQEHKIGPGTSLDPATERGVTVQSVDDAAGTVRICRAANRRDEPLPHALIPGKPYDTSPQQAALRRLAADVIDRGLHADGTYRALREILRHDGPTTPARHPDGRLQAGAFDLDEAKRIVRGLDGSHLFIQGPPGSGKTYNAAHLILDLIDQGARVGVAAGSHAAIHNLLHEVERFAGPEGVSFRGIKRPGASADSRFTSRLDTPLIETSSEIADVLDPATRLVAGTAWLFARPELEERLDYLFIDEAGQISLADALAMGTAATNVVLVGDPLQLAQVSQAVHPPGAGASCLEHLLGDDGTIPPARGLFIDETRRMHPDVCEFVSKAIYEGRLRSVESCADQWIEGHGALTGTGMRSFLVDHAGNARQSPEEADLIAGLVAELLEGGAVKEPGRAARPLSPSDVMVVAPYNAQVRRLRDRLPAGVRVGTVDKFQGQEAAVAFFSMATSSGEELPRNVEFLYSRNRLNVAVSRARCLAVLVASPQLLRIRCRTAEQMRLVNALCLLVEMARRERPD